MGMLLNIFIPCFAQRFLEDGMMDPRRSMLVTERSHGVLRCLQLDKWRLPSLQNQTGCITRDSSTLLAVETVVCIGLQDKIIFCWPQEQTKSSKAEGLPKTVKTSSIDQLDATVDIMQD